MKVFSLRLMLRLMLVSQMVILFGCSLIPVYERPQLPVDNHWDADSSPGAGSDQKSKTPAALIGWRDFFLDPILAELIALSLANNRDLRIAAENVAADRAQYQIDRSSLLPTINGVGSVTNDLTPADVAGTEGIPGLGGPLRTRQYSLGLSISSFELDFFGKINSQARQAYETYLGEEETRTSTQISLVAQVASEYLTWLADRESLDISLQTSEAQHQAYELRRINFKGGNDTELTLLQAETTWRTAEASAAQYQRQVAQDMDELVLLVGAPLPSALLEKMKSAVSLAKQPEFPHLPESLPSDLLERRPDIRAAEHNLLAANANIGAARAAFFPSITLTGSGGVESASLSNLFNSGQGFWSFTPQINLPIFDFGKNSASLDYARIEKRIEIATYEKTIQSAFHDVSDALVARSTYRSQLEAQSRLVGADQRYYELSNMRFQGGIDTFLNVLIAQNSLFAAQLNEVSVRLSEQQNLVTLYKALGGGWSEHTVKNNTAPFNN